MNKSHQVAADYEAAGYHFPIRAMDAESALGYRRELETVEQLAQDNPDNVNANIWFTNANFVLPFVDEITRMDAILDPVKAILGPDVLVWNSSFFSKDANSPDFVSWHQDLKYWGLSDIEEVTAWVALSPSTVESGCMRVVPGSHKLELADHKDTFSDVNMLSRGQELAVEVDESEAVDVELQPGEFSLHHGRLFHASRPNRSADRRIGLAIRYISPAMSQRGGVKTYAHLVAGEDHHGHFHLLPPPRATMAAKDVDVALENIRLGEQFFYENAAGRGKALR